MAQKVIKNTPYIHISEEGKYSLVQEQVVFVEEKKKVKEFNETVILIADIWEDLKNKSGEWKWNGKKYFYWECDTTSLEGETVKVKIEAPTPVAEVFADSEGKIDLEILDEDSDWAKYWKKAFSVAEENYQSNAKITEEKIDGMKTALVDYTPGNESFPEFDPNESKTDDHDLISSLQTMLF